MGKTIANPDRHSRVHLRGFHVRTPVTDENKRTLEPRQYCQMEIRIVTGDITTIAMDAIVNAANETLRS